MKRIIVFGIVGFLFLVSRGFAQDKRTIGLSGSVQNGQYGIICPIWLGEKFVLAPAIDVKFAQSIGTDFGLELAPRYYLKTEKLSPYLGIRVGAIINKPSSKNETDTGTKTDFLLGLAFGGEYFLTDQFSFGIEGQGNFTRSDKKSLRFGNPGGTNFNLGTMISATIYF